MNKIKNIDNYTDKEWEELAFLLSEEQTEQSENLSRFREEDLYSTEKQWNELTKIKTGKEINIDKAWDNVYSEINKYGLLTKSVTTDKKIGIRTIIRIAAVFFILLGLSGIFVYLNNTGALSRKIVYSTNDNLRNLEELLPDGSKVFLNRNTKLSYHSNFGKNQRKVFLKGEAYFEVNPDASKPFIIDAGKARVKVLGTSFNVITKNPDNAVEVYVSSGKVMLSDNSGSENLVLDPGFIGTMKSKQSGKFINNDQNYMSWNTNMLAYNGQKLDIVFKDLKKVYNIDIVVNDPEILKETVTGIYDNQPADTLINIICTTFILKYEKDGNVYHLSRK